MGGVWCRHEGMSSRSMVVHVLGNLNYCPTPPALRAGSLGGAGLPQNQRQLLALFARRSRSLTGLNICPAPSAHSNSLALSAAWALASPWTRRISLGG